MALLPFKQLNPTQRNIATGRNRVVRVTGGPGTGKTVTAASRYRYLVTQQHVQPRHILLLTFSRRQREKLLTDLLPILPAASLDLWIETFHSCTHRILQRHTHAVEGLSADFTRLAEFDQWLLMRETAGDTQLNSFLEEAKGLDGFAETMLESVRIFKQNLVEPENLADILRGRDIPDAIQDVAALYQAYTERVVGGHYMDPGDLVKIAVEMLGNTHVRRWCHTQFQHIIVDEMQELDPAQFRLLELLHHDDQSLVAFGDAYQSVYQFRGAIPETFGERFANLFPGSDERQLTKTYRCPRKLVEPLQRLLQVSEHDPHIPQSSISSDKPVITVHRTLTAEYEAEWIAAEIRRLTRQDAGAEYRDITVILRSFGAFADILHHALEALDIPHHMDPPARLETTPAARVMFAALDCIQTGATVESLDALLQQGPLRVPPEQRWKILRVWNAAGEQQTEDALAHLQSTPLLQAFLRTVLQFAAESNELVAMAQCLSAQLLDVLRDDGTLPPQEPEIRPVLHLVKKFNDAAARLGYPATCAGFMEFIDQGIPDWVASDTNSRITVANSVAIQTVQAAKGSEYRFVFMPQLSHDVFPTSFQHAAFPFSHIPAFIKECVDRRTDDFAFIYQPGRAETFASHLEAEQRLFYVGITRTSESVYCTCPQTGASGENLEPSIFLKRLLNIRSVSELATAGSQSVRIHAGHNEREDRLPENDFDALEIADNAEELAVVVRCLLHRGALGDIENAEMRQQIATVLGDLYDPEFLFDSVVFPCQAPVDFELSKAHRLSASKLTCYAGCPRKYFYTYIAGLQPPETIQMKIGQFEHAVLQHFHDGGKSDQGALQSVFDALWQERQDDFGSGVLRDSWREYMWDCLMHYRDEAAGLLNRPIALEQHHVLKCEQNVCIAGVVDRVDTDDQGLEIIDYKKSGKDQEAALVNAVNRRLQDNPKNTQVQLPIYAAMIAAAHAQQANRLTLLYLDFKKSRMPRKVTLEIRDEPTTKKRRKWLHQNELKDAQRAIQDFAASVYQKRIDFARGEHAECRNFFGMCEYRNICPHGRDA